MWFYYQTLCVLFFLVSCGYDGESGVASREPRDASIDTVSDTATDTTEDVISDAGSADTTLDVSPDSPTDSAPDASEDASEDGTVDSDVIDAAEDTMLDTGPDADIGPPPEVIAIAAGGNHSCALFDDGTLKCWGCGTFGQLGYGSEDHVGDDETPDSMDAVDVGARVASIAAGGQHTCALLEDGSILCWGDGQYGQLGYGDTENIGDNEAPSSVDPISFESDVIQIALGEHHSCALLESAEVQCWGRNHVGQLGLGHTDQIGDDELPSSIEPVRVGGSVDLIVAGREHTCARIPDVGTRCWGGGSRGQLGNDSYANVGDNEFPETTRVIHDWGYPALFQSLAAGGFHTCSVKEDVHHIYTYCWGFGLYYQLGSYNYSSNRFNPGNPIRLGTTTEQLALGFAHTCALDEDGAIRCWGTGSHGRLGYGNTHTISDNEYPQDTPTLDIGGDVTMIASGNSHTCALLETGSVRCWGWGVYGALGYGNRDSVGDDETPDEQGDVPLW